MGDSGSLAGGLTMADNTSDDEVIHLGSFSARRSQGKCDIQTLSANHIL